MLISFSKRKTAILSRKGETVLPESFGISKTTFHAKGKLFSFYSSLLFLYFYAFFVSLFLSLKLIMQIWVWFRWFVPFFTSYVRWGFPSLLWWLSFFFFFFILSLCFSIVRKAKPKMNPRQCSLLLRQTKGELFCDGTCVRPKTDWV